jgi:hypothetical protein
MAQLTHGGLNPIVGGLLGWITYFIIGQGKKGIISLGLIFVASWCAGLGVLLMPLAMFDAYKVCQALKNGEAVDENEYRFGLWFSLCKLVHKEAILKEG